MYTGQLMMYGGGIMIGISVILMLILTVVFGKNKKKLMNKIYGEMQERENK